MARKELQHIKLKKNTHKIKSTFIQEGFVAGIAPNLRGSYSTMYIEKPWIINQFTSISNIEENNAFFKKKIKSGKTTLSVSFDTSINKIYNSDNNHKQGVLIDSVEDMKTLFHEIPLDKITVLFKINENILPILAFYIVTAEEKNISLNDLSIIIQNNTPSKFNSYPPSFITNIFKHTSNIPNLNYSISGYNSQKKDISPEIELAYSLTNGLEYLKKGIESGINIDDIAPKLSFFWTIGMNHFSEIAKLRAARILWAKSVKQFNPKKSESLILKSHCQTNESSLTQQDPYNNITRITIEAIAAVFGGTQSLQTNEFDKNDTSLTGLSSKIAKNTQVYLQKETNITKTVDPWAGSYHLEKLTEDITIKAWQLITEIEEIGGIIKAIEKDFFQKKIEKDAKLKNQEKKIIRLNKHPVKEEAPFTASKINNEIIQNSKIKKLNKLKSNRNNLDVKKSLDTLTAAVKSNKENLLDLTIKAVKKKVTLSEISDALEKGFNRI